MEAIKELERKVEAAAKAIEKLKRENRTLKARVKKLGGDAAGGPPWAKERKVVQGRLTELADHLEELL